MPFTSTLSHSARREHKSTSHRHSVDIPTDHYSVDPKSTATYHPSDPLNIVPRRPCNLDLTNSSFDSSKEKMRILMSQLPSPMPAPFDSSFSNYTVSNRRRSRGSCMFDPNSTYSANPVSFQDVNGFMPPTPVAPVSSVTTYCHQRASSQHHHTHHNHHHEHEPSPQQPAQSKRLSQRKSFSKLFNGNERDEKPRRPSISAPIF